MIYISPEMAQSESFAKLWKDHRFRDRLQAVIIDEAHCVDEWGTEDFRGHYRRLSTLRHYTGHEMPFVACTATCPTSTFGILWDTLSFGLRPFWGIDVGADRPNGARPRRRVTAQGACCHSPLSHHTHSNVVSSLAHSIHFPVAPDEVPIDLVLVIFVYMCRK